MIKFINFKYSNKIFYKINISNYNAILLVKKFANYNFGGFLLTFRLLMNKKKKNVETF